MEWTLEKEISPAKSEVTDDSEADSLPVAAPLITANYDDDDDDAESSSEGFVVDEGRAARRNERWMSWRSWLVERNASECEVVVDCHERRPELDAAAEGEEREEEEDTATTTSTAEMESNKLFWEACLADGF